MIHYQTRSHHKYKIKNYVPISRMAKEHARRMIILESRLLCYRKFVSQGKLLGPFLNAVFLPEANYWIASRSLSAWVWTWSSRSKRREGRRRTGRNHLSWLAIQDRRHVRHPNNKMASSKQHSRWILPSDVHLRTLIQKYFTFISKCLWMSTQFRKWLETKRQFWLNLWPVTIFYVNLKKAELKLALRFQI